MKKTLPWAASWLLALMMLFSLNGWGQETVIYTTGFEADEEFTASTSYNNTEIRYDGPVGEQWGTYYGTTSTTGAIAGSQSMQMRWYTSTVENLGYTFTNFDLLNVTKVEFLASNTNDINVTVSYSTDGGITFTGEELFALSGTATTYTYYISATGEHQNVRLKFQLTLPDPIPGGTSRLYIDDVVVYGIPSDDPILTATPPIISRFWYATGSGPSASRSFELTGDNLDNSDVTVTAPANFEVSADDVTFSDNITLTAYDGAATDIFTRMKEDLAEGDYSGDILITGGGTETATEVSVSGTVVEAFAIDYVNELRTNLDYNTALAQGFNFVDAVLATAAGGRIDISPNGYIETPTIDFTAFNSLEVEFDLANFGSGADRALSIKVSSDNGATYDVIKTTDVDTASPDYLTVTEEIDLTGTYNVATGKIRFEMTGGTGGIRFRDLSITDADPVPAASASLNPATAEFDVIAPDDVTTTITWNDATALTSITLAGDDLVETTDYTLATPDNVESLLTLMEALFANSDEGDQLVFTLNFDVGDAATFTVTIVDGTPVPATIAPVARNFFLDMPQAMATTITWNDATQIVSIEENDNTLEENTDYELDGNTLTILAAYFAAAGHEDVLEFLITFDLGTATFTVSVFDTDESDDVTLKIFNVGGVNVLPLFEEAEEENNGNDQ